MSLERPALGGLLCVLPVPLLLRRVKLCVWLFHPSERWDETYCVTSSILPSQAIGVTRGSEALETMMPSPQGERQNCEVKTCLPVLGRQERGWSGKVNRSERLINVGIANKPKALTGLDQKVGSKDAGLRRSPS